MKGHVLVVDDDHGILELLSALLESEGYRVWAYDSGDEALEAALRHPPDVAVIDLMMPGMSGSDLVRALRRDSRTSGVPVLICSAYHGDLRKSMRDREMEAVTLLAKPFHIDEFLEIVERMAFHCGGSRPGSQAATIAG